MDDSQLRGLAEAFYSRLLAAWQALPPPRPTLREQEFWTRHFIDFAHEVSRDARESEARVLRRIQQIASQQHELLSPTDKILGPGRVLRDIADAADAALRASAGKEHTPLPPR
jgi:hypothetical protein